MKKVYLLSVFLICNVQFILSQDFAWSGSMGDGYKDRGQGIEIDTEGNVYTVGYYKGEMDVDFSEEVEILNSMGTWDGYIVKTNSEGELLWAHAIADKAHDLALDAENNVYITGVFAGTADFDPGEDVFNLTTSAYHGSYILKLDSDGNFVWAKTSGGSGISIDLDTDGNIFVTGLFKYSGDFDPGPGVNILHLEDYYDTFILKLDPDGEFLWAHSFGTTGYNKGVSVTTDSYGNVYFIGNFVGIIDADPSDETYFLNATSSAYMADTFIIKLDPNGNFVWAKNAKGEFWSTSIIIDPFDDVYITGGFQNTIDFNFGDEDFSITSNGADDIYLLKLDLNGEFVWVRTMGNDKYNFGFSLVTDLIGNVYVGSNSKGSIDMDPSDYEDIYTGVERGSDLILQKFSREGEYINGLGWEDSSYYAYVAIYAHDLALSNIGDIYLTGGFENTLDSDPYEGEVNLVSEGDLDIFVIKLNGNEVESINESTKPLFNIYPNPAIDNLTIELSDNSQKGQIQIIEYTGKIILEEKIDQPSTTINVDKLSKGLYLIRFIANDGTSFTKQFVK